MENLLSALAFAGLIAAQFLSVVLVNTQRYSAKVISKPAASTGAAGIGCTARGDITCNPRT